MNRQDFLTLCHLAKSIADDKSVHDNKSETSVENESLHDDDKSVDDDESYNESQQDGYYDSQRSNDNHNEETDEMDDDKASMNWKTEYSDEKEKKRDMIILDHIKKSTDENDNEIDPFGDLLLDRIIRSEDNMEEFDKNVELNKQNEDWSERRINKRA